MNLTYEGETTFTSVIGGIATSIAGLGMLAFFLVQLMRVLNKESDVISIFNFRQVSIEQLEL